LAGLRGEAVIEAAYLVASQSLQRLREEAANRDEDEVLEVQPAEVYEFVICKSYLQDSPPSSTQRMGKCVICGKKGPLGMECSRCVEDSGGRYL
jgi:hypothetical protein